MSGLCSSCSPLLPKLLINFHLLEFCIYVYHMLIFSRDILLGLMKRLIKRRVSNLKVLITSATLDGDKVSKFFSNCPVLTVPGKLYPVEILFSNERSKNYIESSLKKAMGMRRF